MKLRTIVFESVQAHAASVVTSLRTIKKFWQKTSNIPIVLRASALHSSLYHPDLKKWVSGGFREERDSMWCNGVLHVYVNTGIMSIMEFAHTNVRNADVMNSKVTLPV
jgi:hypothetical protein